MRKILGLDIGTNAIGRAIINSDYSIDSVGTRVFPNEKPSQNIERGKKRSYRRLQNQKAIRDKLLNNELMNNRQALIEKLSKQGSLKLDVKYVLCVLLTITMFTCAYFMKSNWQFWLNLGIGGVFILLNMTIVR